MNITIRLLDKKFNKILSISLLTKNKVSKSIKLNKRNTKFKRAKLNKLKQRNNRNKGNKKKKVSKLSKRIRLVQLFKKVQVIKLILFQLNKKVSLTKKRKTRRLILKTNLKKDPLLLQTFQLPMNRCLISNKALINQSNQKGYL